MIRSLLVLVLVVLTSTLPADLDRVDAVSAGTISGTVATEPPPVRRSASRYRDIGSRTKTIQELPAVVYLKGVIPGAPPRDYTSSLSMTQRDTAFAPAAVALQVGGTVDFPNADPFFHNVFSYSSAKRFDLGRYPEGESKQVSFETPGIVEIFCEVHDFMRGAIVVTENPFHAVVSSDGSFSIAGVPPGDYTLVAWQSDHDPIEVPVHVSDGADTRIEVELHR